MTRQMNQVTKKSVRFSAEDSQIILNDSVGLSSSEHEAVFYNVEELTQIRRAIQISLRIKNDDECFRGLETLQNTSSTRSQRYKFIDDFLTLQIQSEDLKPEEQERALSIFVISHGAASQLEARKLGKLDELEARDIYKQDNISYKYQGKKKPKRSMSFMKAFARPSFYRPMRSKLSLSVNRMS